MIGMHPVPHYTTASFLKTYDAILAAAQGTSSELNHDGKPHRGAAHRTAFWNGYGGLAEQPMWCQERSVLCALQQGKSSPS